jgi:RNA polymerase sigma-70 factor (ECF subfamily)
VQGTFERAFAALGKYPEERIRALFLRPWLYRIALNFGAQLMARSSPEEARGPTLGEVRWALGVQGWASLPAQTESLGWTPLGALGRLSERQRVAVTLRYLEDCPTPNL